MMENYLVYWVSGFNGKTPGLYTEASKPNVMFFGKEDQSKALKFRAKLSKLCETNGTYRGRLVTHVSDVQFPLAVPQPTLHLVDQKPAMSELEKYHRSQERGKQNSKYTAETIVGKMARADHPITCLNPDEWFEVKAARQLDGRLAIIGENTCWFSIYLCDIKD